MKITVDKKKKSLFEKRYWRITRKVLAKVRQPVVDFAQHTDPERLRAQVERLLDVKPVKMLIEELWTEVGGRFGFDTELMIRSAKKGLELKEDVRQTWDNRMKVYVAQRSLKKAQAIITTEQEAINRVIDGVIEKSLNEGIGIIETRKLLVKDLQGDVMMEMENWQAQRIAITEVGSAQNTSSFEAAQENSEGVKKIWMFIPGLKTFRENHQGFEALGAVDMDYEYAPGLQHPGDENGSAEEVINCYCDMIWDTGN